MAAFSLSTYEIRNKNVRHILSSERPKTVKFREYDGNQELNIQKRYHEQQLKPPERFEEKFMELFKGYNIGLPKAPAFWRPKSGSHLRRIVSRVSTPTHNIPNKKLVDEELCPKNILVTDEQVRAKSAPTHRRHRSMSAKELARSAIRMSTPTKIGRLRYKLRAGQTEIYDSITEVKNVYGDFTKL